MTNTATAPKFNGTLTEFKEWIILFLEATGQAEKYDEYRVEALYNASKTPNPLDVALELKGDCANA